MHAAEDPESDPDFEYDDPVQAVVDQVMDRVLNSRQAETLFSQIQQFVSRAGTAIEREHSPQSPPRRDSRQQYGRRPPTPPRRRRNILKAARKILHFAPGEKLTVQAIKKRKRDLAAVFHPDQGGDPRAMSQINQAADILIKSLKSNKESSTNAV